MSGPFAGIRAQEPAVRTLEEALRHGRLASSYLFEGPSGVGKQRVALALARAVVARGDGAIERRIAAGNHPDVRVFAPRDEGHRNIQVEVLRSEILPVAQYAPFEAESSFLIFPEADVSFPENHPEAANALLKTLEEPRPGVFFVLLAERPDRLLTTIRSRCQRLVFRRLPPAVLQAILAEQAVPEEDRAAAIALADGRADRALLLARDGTARELCDLALRVDDEVARQKPGSLVALAEELGKSDRLRLVLETLEKLYRDVACAALGLPDEMLAFRHVAGTVRERASRTDAARASARLELLRETGDGLEENANPQISVDALLYALREAR
jgi:DNA polymerase-3 subunit delta'